MHVLRTCWEAARAGTCCLVPPNHLQIYISIARRWSHAPREKTGVLLRTFLGSCQTETCSSLLGDMHASNAMIQSAGDFGTTQRLNVQFRSCLNGVYAPRSLTCTPAEHTRAV